MATSARKTAVPKAESQATSYARARQQENGMRLGAFLVVALLLAFPLIPSPLFGVGWLDYAAPSLGMLVERMPPEPMDMVVFTIPSQPIGLWLYWGLSAFLSFVCLSLLLHLSAIYGQRTRSIGQPRTYIRLTVPASATGKPTDALSLLKTLHGMVAPTNPMQPTAAPIMLCWTARPERKNQQAVSVALAPTAVTGVQKRLQGITGGTKAVIADDPLLQELQPGRFLCVAEARTVAGDAFPIAVIGREQGLLAAMLPALAPQAGVIVAGVRIMLEPIADRCWRLDVLALLERLKLDTGTDEQQALKAKAAGPAYRSRYVILAVADNPLAGTAQVQTIASALASSTQAVGMIAQRLQAGAVQVLPAVFPPAVPLPTSRRWVGLLIGLVMALACTVGLWKIGMLPVHPLLWAMPLLIIWVPVLCIGVQWRRRQNADMRLRHGAITSGVLPPRNPRVVPLWWPWLGYKD